MLHLTGDLKIVLYLRETVLRIRINLDQLGLITDLETKILRSPIRIRFPLQEMRSRLALLILLLSSSQLLHLYMVKCWSPGALEEPWPGGT